MQATGRAIVLRPLRVLADDEIAIVPSPPSGKDVRSFSVLSSGCIPAHGFSIRAEEELVMRHSFT
jgi:hypothetical protein